MLLTLRTLFVAILFGLCAGAAGAHAQETLQAEPRFVGERVVFTVNGAYSGFLLTVSGPEDYYARVEAARSAPTLRLRDHGAVPDGVYRWELTAATTRTVPGASRQDQARNGRAPGAGVPRIGAQTSGVFRVADGRIQIFEQLQEPAPGAGQAG